MIALEALRAGEEDRALDLLVEAWRKSRDPALREAIEELGTRLDKVLPPIAGKLADFQPAWLAAAEQRRAADVPRLLRSILHTTQQSGVAITEALLARGKALARWPADPRISLAIAAHLRKGPFNATGKAQQPFWKILFDLVLAHDDAAAIPAFAALDFKKIWKGWNDVAARIAFLQPAVRDVVAELERRKRAAPVTTDVAAIRAAVRKLGPVDASLKARLAAPVPVAKKAKPAPSPAPALDSRAALGALEAALAANDEESMLEALLKAWRTTRAPAIGDLIAAVSKPLESRLAPIAGKTRKEIQDAWLAVAARRHAVDLPRLLASITHTHHRATDALARLEALRGWPPDPRAAAGAVANLEEIPFYTSSTKPFWAALIGFAVEHGDRHTADALEKVAGRLGSILHAPYTDLTAIRTWFKNQLNAAVVQLRARETPPWGDDLASAVARLSDRVNSSRAPAERLFAAVFAAPDDDEPRHVLGDHLQELRDPRGELIALQLAGADPARVEELLGSNIRRWLGPLAPLVEAGHCNFERGFLSDVVLWDAAPDAIARTAGAPIWATVRRLTLPPRGPLPEELLRHPVMASLEHLGICDPAQLTALLAWDAIPYTSLGLDFELGPAENRAVSKLARVRTLELEIDTRVKAAPLFDSPLGKRLECVVWRSRERGGGSLELKRKGRVFALAHATIGADLWVARVVEMVGSLPSVTELRITGRLTKPDRAKLDKLGINVSY